MCILQIGELVGKIDSEFKQEYDAVPWKQIKTMRNIYAHNYSNVDYDMAWNTIEVDIPELRKYCVNILEDLQKKKQKSIRNSEKDLDL